MPKKLDTVCCKQKQCLLVDESVFGSDFGYQWHLIRS